MKTKSALILGTFLTATLLASAAPLGTAFTYQGRLADNGAPANGNYDLRFFLFDVPAGGVAIGGPITNANLVITDGLFAVTLDFGDGVFDGPARWLQIGVRTNGSGAFTAVLPRQPLTPSPYAIYATSVRLTNGAVDTPQLANDAVTRAKIASNAVDTAQLADAAVTSLKLALGAVDTAQIANGAVTTIKLASNAVTTAKIADFAVDTAQLANTAVTTVKLTNEAVTTAKLANDSVTSAKVLNGTLIPADLDVDRFNTTFWRTGGNSNTTAGTHFIGTTDNEAFEIHVNGDRALRIAPTTNGVPNIVAGASVNFVSSGKHGATIAGGGIAGYINRVTDDWGTVGGGYDNRADYGATVAGGGLNVASGYGSTVSGGGDNTASGFYATIPGGIYNFATGNESFAFGYHASANHDGSVVWALGNSGEFPSEEENRFHIYADQGFQIEFGGQVNGVLGGRGNQWVIIGSANTPTKLINTFIGAYLSIGGAWVNASDRNRKENFAPVDTRAVLEKVAALPLTTWNYKSEDASTKHLGPMAQDFRAAFGLGNDEKGIGTVDADGVALAAIQGLNEIVKQKETRITALEKTVGELKELVLKLAEKR